MRKIISFMHISLDGFVSGPNGEMNWIKMDQQIFDFVGIRIHKGDTALYGRITYQMMENYWPDAGNKPDASAHDKAHAHWYNQINKVVLSHSLEDQPTRKTRIISKDLVESIHTLKETEGEDILIFGSPTATHALMDLNLIDGYWLFVNPVILGKGVRLFSKLNDQINLKLLSSKVFDSGVTELNYVVDQP